MRLTISSITGGASQVPSQVLRLDVPGSISVADLKSLITSELPSVPATTQYLYYNGRLLSEASRTLEEYNMKDDDMVVVHYAGASSSRQLQQQPMQQQQLGTSQAEYDAEIIRLEILGKPHLQSELRETQPELLEVVNDPQRFREAFNEMQRQKAEAKREKQREIQMLNEDPFNVEAQQKIEELIRIEQVMENLQSAIEHHPEVTFGRVTMLYIPVEVNGTAVQAYVDSGAQTTVMSPSCAERCNIMRLIDTRFSGIARGVGTARILGRVHSAQIKIGSLYLACSFTVMEGKHVDLLLGLDMLKRHQATLDLKRGCLMIQDVEVPFLGESEIPKQFGGDAEDEAEPTVEGPGGSKVGGRSGAIIVPPAPVIRNIPQAQETAAAATASNPYSEAVVLQLEGLGFTRQEVLAALHATGGDIDMAANWLFN